MKKPFPAFIFFLMSFAASAQDTLVITMEEAIEMAQHGSITSKQIKNNFQSSYWAYKAYKARRLPSIGFSGTVPNFNRSITAVPQPDGTQNFVSQNTLNSDVGLDISQAIPASGGSIFMNSGLQRIDNLDNDDGTSYSASPISIGFRQDLFAFNSFKWDKKTEPMRLEQASREQVESMEQLTIQLVQVYFGYVLSQENLKIANKNHANNKDLFRIAQGRYELGKIAKNDLLQMELSVLQASTALETSKIQVQRSKNELFTLLSIKPDQEIRLVIPHNIPLIEVDPKIAVEEAKKNRKDFIGFELRKIEADMNVARAKAEKKPQLNLNGSFGLNKQVNEPKYAYRNPLDQQERFNLGVSVPVYDGGQRKSQYKIAVSEQELVYAELEQQRLAFERDVHLKALEIEVLKTRLYIAAKSDSIAHERYEITRQRYLIGKIDITELNLALNSKDQSRRGYIQSLKEYWEAYFNLRKLTLYDFRSQSPLYIMKEK